MPRFAADLARARPDEVALADPWQSLTWGDVDGMLDRIANGLAALDLEPSQRVAVFAENAAETALANLGGLIAGVSVTPVNFHLNAEEAAYILKDAGIAVLFVDAATAERGLAAARLARVPTVIGWGGVPDEATDFATWLQRQSGEPCDEARPPRPNLLYTSGTTGRPKAVELPPTMFAGGSSVAEHLERLKANPHAGLGTHLVVGPMYHTGPLSRRAAPRGRHALRHPGALRCRGDAGGRRAPPHREHRHGADALHPPARAARTGAPPL